MEKTRIGFADAGVTGVEYTENRKLTASPKERRYAATYVSQNSCPTTCMLRNNGCYAEGGPTGIITKRLTNGSDANSLELAQREAAIIDAMSGKYPLRLHIVGDCVTNEAAQIVSAAADRYRAKHGMAVHTYTHGWRMVERASWGAVSVLASCETVADVELAKSKGYATAIVVDASKPIPVKAIVCPVATGKLADCHSCKLCSKSELLSRTGVSIALPIHGHRTKHVAKMLDMVN